MAQMIRTLVFFRLGKGPSFWKIAPRKRTPFFQGRCDFRWPGEYIIRGRHPDLHVCQAVAWLHFFFDNMDPYNVLVELDMHPPPPKSTPSKSRTLLGLINLHTVLISSLSPGGVHLGGGAGGCIVTPNGSHLHVPWLPKALFRKCDMEVPSPRLHCAICIYCGVLMMPVVT